MELSFQLHDFCGNELRQHSRNPKNSKEDDFGIKLPITNFTNHFPGGAYEEI